MPTALLLWYACLCAFALLNVVAWAWTARRLALRSAELSAEVLATRRRLLGLSAVYVLGCAFRAVFPMLDEPRICLHDTVLSRIAVGRGIATIAELCFVVQWALLLREAAGTAGHRFVKHVAFGVLPLAVAAEGASWLAILTRNNFLHAVENSLWTFGAALVLVALWALRGSADARDERRLAAGIAAIAVYLVFMLTVDVPMYLNRWYASGGAGLPLVAGVEEVLRRCTPTYVVAAWRQDMPWLTLYFSAAVWLSIALVHAPSLRRTDSRFGASRG